MYFVCVCVEIEFEVSDCKYNKHETNEKKK